jgi:LysM domain
MVAIQVPQAEPEIWFEPSGGRGDEPQQELPTRQRRPRTRALPDRATRIRRRRLALLLTSVAVLLGGAVVARLFVGGTFGSAPADARPASIDGQVYIVQPGDSLWSIAERVADGGDPRPVVARLRDQQGDAELEVGDRLTIEP